MGCHVFFAIPISPKLSDEQWDHLDALLTLTLESIDNQTDKNYTVYVCGHSCPPAVASGSFKNVEFLQADFPVPTSDDQRRRDKRRKRWRIATEVHKRGGGYYMYLDADDLVHKDLVAYVRSDNNEVGYLITHGYALDYANRRIAPIPGAWRKQFNEVCGSSGIVYMLPEDLPTEPYPSEPNLDLLYFQISNHTRFATMAMREGKQLAPLPFPGGIYTLNHALNLSSILVRTEERQVKLIESIKRLKIDDVSEINDNFGLNGFISNS